MKSSFNRRNFLKLSGFAALSVGSGFTVGKLLGRYQKSQYAIYGFLPSDDILIAKFINVFSEKVKCNSEPVIIAGKNYYGILKKLFDETRSNLFDNGGAVTYSIKKISKQIKSDIIISDNQNPIYSINADMDSKLRNLRLELKERKADVYLSAVFNQFDFLYSLISSNHKEIVIYSENKLFDRIPINSLYKNIEVKGPQGITEIEADNGLVRVVKSTCRHKLCEKTGYAANTGDVLACAPNRVLVKIEKV